VVERMHLPITESTRLDQGEVLEGLQHEQGLLLFRGPRGSKKKIRDEIQRRKWDPEIKKFYLGITLMTRCVKSKVCDWYWKKKDVTQGDWVEMDVESNYVKILTCKVL
ncbi:hypothetical protein Tco_0612537, partial [Tanacetum coccineum]